MGEVMSERTVEHVVNDLARTLAEHSRAEQRRVEAAEEVQRIVLDSGLVVDVREHDDGMLEIRTIDRPIVIYPQVANSIVVGVK